MKKEFTDKNKKNINILIALLVILILISFLIITKKYDNFESDSNSKSINNLINKVQSEIEFNHKIALEYSTRDDTYEFIENENKDYIYKNFRKGSYTLEDIGLSYFILTDKENDIKYSTYSRNIHTVETDDFEQYIINKTKDIEQLNKVIIYQNEAYYLSKLAVYKTDYENNSNGFLLIGSKIDTSKLKNISKEIKSIDFISKPDIMIKKTKFRYISTKVKNNINYNEISLYNKNSKLIFSIKTKSDLILKNTRSLLLIIFLGLVVFTIFTLLYIKNKYTNDLKVQDASIKKMIDEETDQFKVGMKELQKVNKNLYELAHTDFLTKTMNRRNFFINAQNIFSIAQKNNQQLCVVMIDIDNFKKFNDNYGHSIGDKVLVLFAQRIKNTITEKTIFGRLGGEEFALLIKDTNLEDAIVKAEKIKKKVEEIELIVEGQTLKITASFGVSDNNNCTNIDDMLQKADNLLYTAKESGRNLVRSRLNFC